MQDSTFRVYVPGLTSMVSGESEYDPSYRTSPPEFLTWRMNESVSGISVSARVDILGSKCHASVPWAFSAGNLLQETHNKADKIAAKYRVKRQDTWANGERYEGEMKQTFTKETFAPNAPITINGGWMRNKVNGKVFKVKGKGSSRPLVDEGRLRGSIIHKVAKV